MSPLSARPKHIEWRAICGPGVGRPYRISAPLGGKTREGAGFAAPQCAAFLPDALQPLGVWELGTAGHALATGWGWVEWQRDVAQSGSAPEWGSGGRGFKSRRPDFGPRLGGGRVVTASLACRSNPAVPSARSSPPALSRSRTRAVCHHCGRRTGRDHERRRPAGVTATSARYEQNGVPDRMARNALGRSQTCRAAESRSRAAAPVAPRALVGPSRCPRLPPTTARLSKTRNTTRGLVMKRCPFGVVP